MYQSNQNFNIPHQAYLWLLTHQCAQRGRNLTVMVVTGMGNLKPYGRNGGNLNNNVSVWWL